MTYAHKPLSSVRSWRLSHGSRSRHRTRQRGISLFELRESFHLCAAQRLMQALGAYGNLSQNLGKPQFKQHIPAAVKNLTLVCRSSPALKELLPLFETA